MNDNQNYFVTRSTSRVLSVPGGKCSIDIFGDADSNSNHGSHKSKQPPAVATAASTTRCTANAAPAPSTQSAPDAMQMKNEAARNKHRAMDESFDLFGSAPVAAPKPAKATVTVEINEEEDAASAGVSCAKTTTTVSSNQFASANTTNSYNVITDRPTSRVLQPPGGNSSDFIFG